MSEIRPSVSIGMPVFNGEPFLEEALDSILAQTYYNFELIISDNASTDRTQEICTAYAAKDKRIRYFRNDKNLGAAKNYNRVFALSSGEYFKWAAHDDICAPVFLLRCVTVLDQNPSVVLCYPREVGIDEQGKFLGRRPYKLDTSLAKPSERLRNLTRLSRGSPPIFGVIRTSVLRQTPLIGNYYASDQVLLAELALHGRFHEVPEDLLLHREHSRRSVYVHPTRHSWAPWLDPTRVGRIVFPTWRFFVEYLRSIRNAPVSLHERIRCNLHMIRWLVGHRRAMVDDVIIAAKQMMRARRKLT